MKNGKAELWFITGSQHLYGEETLKQVNADSKAIAEAVFQVYLGNFKKTKLKKFTNDIKIKKYSEIYKAFLRNKRK